MSHSQTPVEETQEKKPLSKGKKITVGIVIGVLAVGGIGALLEGDPEPVDVPDVIGLAGDEAKDVLQESGLEPTLESEDSSVWSPENWEVASTNPEAGEVSAEGEEVTVSVVRPASNESEDQDESENAEDDPSTPATEFTFTTEEVLLDVDTPGEYGTEILVTWDIEMGFTGSGTERIAKNDSFEAIQQAIDYEPNYDRISLNGYTETVDEFGNNDRSLAIIAAYDRQTVEQINFDNPENVDIWSINDDGAGCIPCS